MNVKKTYALQGESVTSPRSPTKPEPPSKPIARERQGSTETPNGDITAETKILKPAPKPPMKPRTTSGSSQAKVVVELPNEVKPIPNVRPRPTPPRAKPRSSIDTSELLIPKQSSLGPEPVAPVIKPRPSRMSRKTAEVTKTEHVTVSDPEDDKGGKEEARLPENGVSLKESTNNELQESDNTNDAAATQEGEVREDEVEKETEGAIREDEVERETGEKKCKSEEAIDEDTLEKDTLYENVVAKDDQISEQDESDNEEYEEMSYRHSVKGSKRLDVKVVEDDLDTSCYVDMSPTVHTLEASKHQPAPASTNADKLCVDEIEVVSPLDDAHDYNVPTAWKNATETSSASLSGGVVPMDLPSNQQVSPIYDVPRPLTPVEQGSKPSLTTVEAVTRNISPTSSSSTSPNPLDNLSMQARRGSREGRKSLPRTSSAISGTDTNLESQINLSDISIEVRGFYPLLSLCMILLVITFVIWFPEKC